MQPLPGAPLKVVQATFPFRIFVELPGRPAQMGQLYQARDGSIGRQRTEESPRLTVLSWERPLPEQPAFWPGPAASMGLTMAGPPGNVPIQPVCPLSLELCRPNSRSISSIKGGVMMRARHHLICLDQAGANPFHRSLCFSLQLTTLSRRLRGSGRHVR